MLETFPPRGPTSNAPPHNRRVDQLARPETLARLNLASCLLFLYQSTVLISAVTALYESPVS